MADLSTLIMQSDAIGTAGRFLEQNDWIVSVLFFSIFGLMGWLSYKKMKEVAALIRSGFRGVIVIKSWYVKPDMKTVEEDVSGLGPQPRLRVLGIDCNGIGIGDMLSFDKDPFQTKLRVVSVKQVMNRNTHAGYMKFGTTRSAGFGGIIHLFDVIGRKIMGGTYSPSKKSELAADLSSESAALNQYMYMLQAMAPTDIKRLMESQAIGQGNKTVLKAKNLKLVLR